MILGALIIGVQEGRAKEEQLRAGVFYQKVVSGSLSEWELWSTGLVSQISWARVSCRQCGQLSSDGRCCETVQSVGLCDVGRWSCNFFHQTGEFILRMRHAFPRSTVFLAIDANARVGSEDV